ncbi:hypothetical protein O6H91_10G063800 [Diphasiastrum complanatum]|nr:hypothetical protein O6H91_10G063800 [Diphasiastrum complanatum]
MITSHNVLVVSINGAGSALESIYLIIYLVFAPKKKKAVIFLLVSGILAFCVTIVAVTIAEFPRHDRAIFVGSVCVVIGTLMYASPLLVMRLVITTRSVEYMPFLLSICSFFNAILWTSYGALKKDKFIIIPNGLGCLLGAAQLGLYANYHNGMASQGRPSESNDLDVTAQNNDKTKQRSPGC